MNVTEVEKNVSSLSDYSVATSLVDRASKGDRKALSELCDRIAKGVLYRVKYGLNNLSDAEDVSQEVLIRVCQRIHELRAPSAFRAWLGKIIINETCTYLRRNIKQRDTADIDNYVDSLMEGRETYLPEEFVENADSRIAVLEAISKLPVRQRQAVVFHYYDGLNINDIAEAMGLAQSSVSTHLARAREVIKSELRERTQAAIPLEP